MTTPPIVIIAEPDPIISSVLRVEFTHRNFAVFLAASGPEAEDYAGYTVAHLIILDARLQIGAYEACARIRRRQGYSARPIVVTASKPSLRIKAAAATAGATVLLMKPYSVDHLFSAITPFLEPDDLLLTHRLHDSGLASPSQEWAPAGKLRWESGTESALTRNGRLLPIVRGAGVRIPLLRKS
ncbi:MAG TPA: response regulator [Rhodopila sp.]